MRENALAVVVGDGARRAARTMIAAATFEEHA